MHTAHLGNERGGQNFWLEVLNNAANFVVIAEKEEFQRTRVLAKQQAQLQSGPAFKNIFSQSSDGHSGVRVGTAKTFGNELRRRFHAGEIRITQICERLTKARAEQNDGSRHASIFP